MASSLMQIELDPLFAKALRLLRSRHADSTEELKDLVQDYREKILNGGLKKTDGTDRHSPKFDNKGNSNRINPVSTPSSSSVIINNNNASSGNGSDNKRPAVVLSGSLMDSLKEVTYENEQKGKSLAEVESIEEITLGSSLQPTLKRKRKAGGGQVGHHENMLDISSPESDPNDSIPIDQIIEMDFGGPTCDSCHLGKRSEDDNDLVECSECHLSYHQQCHKPNVTTKEINDPRLIWYCSKCMKKMKKEMAAQQANNNKSIETISPVQKMAVSNPFQQQAKPFRRPSTIPTPEKINPTSAPPANPSNSNSDTSITTGSATVEESSSSSSSSSTSSREGSPSQGTSATKYNRNREMAKQAMNRLEQVRKRAKMQQNLKQTRK